MFNPPHSAKSNKEKEDNGDDDDDDDNGKKSNKIYAGMCLFILEDCANIIRTTEDEALISLYNLHRVFLFARFYSL